MVLTDEEINQLLKQEQLTISKIKKRIKYCQKAMLKLMEIFGTFDREKDGGPFDDMEIAEFQTKTTIITDLLFDLESVLV